jgi:hypothetical protein
VHFSAFTSFFFLLLLKKRLHSRANAAFSAAGAERHMHGFCLSRRGEGGLGSEPKVAKKQCLATVSYIRC